MGREAIAALLLRTLASELRGRKQVRESLAGRMGRGDTDAHRHRHRLRAVHVAELARGGEQPPADLGRLEAAATRQQHGEAIAADSAREAVFTRMPAHDVADALNHLVAGMKTEGLVDRLQLVDVDI